MLVLSSESGCDVCAESYSADSLPHSIPCGHTFCAACLSEIAKRHRGACPLCREPFSAGDVRRIRTDQGVSSSPPYPQIQPYPNYYPAPQAQPARGAGGFGAAPLDEDALDADNDGDEDAARRLELRVLDATKKGNSFEDLSRLKREIDHWVARRPDREHMALKISAALLAAILVNGFQHNEARKTAKVAEDSKRKLEAENYRLKVDISKLTGAPPPPPPTPAQPPPVPVPAPRAFGSSLAAPPKPSPLSKLGAGARSQTPGPMPSHRPSAPPPTHRTMTPGPTPTQRTTTPAPPSSRPSAPPPRSQTPAARPAASASPYSPFARASATTSHLPVSPAPASERHRVWMPSTPREDDDGGGGGGKRPGTAAPPGHGRSFSFGFARPRTANGHR